METSVDSGTLWLVLSLAGAVLVIALGIIGFFLRAWMKMIHSDVKENTASIGKNKGNIDLQALQQKQDKVHLEQMTQLEIQGLTKQVEILSGNVNTMTTEIRNLVIGLAGEGFKVKEK